MRVSSAPDASARNSRRLDTIIASVCPMIGARIIAKIQTANSSDSARPLASPASTTAISVATTAAQSPAAPVRHERYRADHCGDNGHQPDIEISNVTELVGNNRLQFFAVDGLQQPLRDSNRRVLRVATGRKRIGIGIRDDEYLGLGQACRNAHFFDDIVELANLEPARFTFRRDKSWSTGTAPVDINTARSPE